MLKRQSIVILAAAFVIATCVFIASSLRADPLTQRITLENGQRIDVGMSASDVESLLGDHYHELVYKYTCTRQWESETTTICVTFDDRLTVLGKPLCFSKETFLGKVRRWIRLK